MLRLLPNVGTYVVPFKIAGEETNFTLRPICVTAKTQLLTELAELPSTVKSFDKVIELVSEHIVSIEGHDDAPAVILGQLQFHDDLMNIVGELIAFATLTREEMEGLESSPGRLSAASAANRVEKPASDAPESPANEPASTTRKKTEAS